MSDIEFPFLRFAVRLEDGSIYEVATDQRDQYKGLAASHVAVVADDFGNQIEVLRCFAWAGLVRTGQITMGWPEFNRLATHCQPVNDDDDGDDDGEAYAIRPTSTDGAD